MHAPFSSTITLLAELLVSVCIYYTLYRGYKRGSFPTAIAAVALAYEAIFNISYMVSRVPANAKATHSETFPVILLAIIHGTLSLVMFVALVLFFVLAWRGYKKGANFFKSHKTATFTFTFFWTFSIVSGILFYALLYLF